MARKQNGFTIVETMIAVTVFSVLALITVMAVIQLSRVYQAGAIKAQLLDASRQVHAQFNQSIAYGSGVSSSVQTANGFNVWCAGSTRFAWKTSSAATVYTDANGSLFTDDVGGVANCTNLFSPGASTVKKMLPNNSFVTDFTPSCNGANICSLSTRFGVGTQDMFVSNDVTKSCDSFRLLGVEFCAVVQYNSNALKKVGN